MVSSLKDLISFDKLKDNKYALFYYLAHEILLFTIAMGIKSANTNNFKSQIRWFVLFENVVSYLKDLVSFQQKLETFGHYISKRQQVCNIVLFNT